MSVLCTMKTCMLSMIVCVSCKYRCRSCGHCSLSHHKPAAAVSCRMEHTLDFSQTRAFQAFRRGFSIALLGGAGSGKSFLLRRMLAEAQEKHGVDAVLSCAWTNQSATSIRGRTIHSVFSLKYGFAFDKEELWAKVKKNELLCDSLRKVKVVFVDEVAILKEKVLDSIDWVLRHLGKSERHACIPMGARQLVLAGDPFQMDPIGVNYCVEGERQVFSARCWFLTFGGFGSGVIALLSTNHRQAGDSAFYKILSRIRDGSFSEDDIDRINSTGMKSNVIPRTHTVLCLRKFKVEEVNKAELARHPGKLLCSRACDTVKAGFIEDLATRLNDAAPKTVSVKAGCDILLSRKVGSAIPGTRATILSVHHCDPVSEDAGLLSLRVKFASTNICVLVSPMRFEILSADSSVVAWRKQIPVVSAYALTVHRCQGLTLDRVAMDFRSISTWIPSGMAYVALSRCTSLDGLWIRGLQKKHIVVNEYARHLMEDIEKLKRHFVHRVIGSFSEIRILRGNGAETTDGGKKRLLEVGVLKEGSILSKSEKKCKQSCN